MPTLTLFKKCLGLNDARAFATQMLKTDPRDPDAGTVELIDCMNLTITDDGCLEKIAPFKPVLTHTLPITGISSGNRFMVQDGINTMEWTTGTALINRMPLTDGPVCHTPIDVRVATSSTVYKSPGASPVMLAATVGINPNPETSTPFYAMPAYKHAGIYNAKLYCVNATDPRFLQYSEDYHFDLFALGDNHLPSVESIMQWGAIPGVMVTTHATGVTVYTGTNPKDFSRKFYPCAPCDNTLFSGLISKSVGYLHLLMAEDGIYAVSPEGLFQRLSESLDHPADVNSSYTCATVTDRKYLAFGNGSCIEYDFKNKSVMKRAPLGVTSATVYHDTTYFSVGSSVVELGDDMDVSGSMVCSMTLPYSDLSTPGKKSFEWLYFTGTLNGTMLITATDENGNFWEKEVSDELIAVSNYRIKTPRGFLGNHVSLKIECTSGSFRIEGLKATFSASKRTR